jgi:hypothetical protein
MLWLVMLKFALCPALARASMLIMHALYLMPFPMTASVPDSLRITPPPGAKPQTGLERNTPKSGARTRRLIDCG